MDLSIYCLLFRMRPRQLRGFDVLDPLPVLFYRIMFTNGIKYVYVYVYYILWKLSMPWIQHKRTTQMTWVNFCNLLNFWKIILLTISLQNRNFYCKSTISVWKFIQKYFSNVIINHCFQTKQNNEIKIQ